MLTKPPVPFDLVGAFSVITNLRMELFEALIVTRDTLHHDTCAECSACQQPVITGGGYANGRLYHQVLVNFPQM